MNRFFFAVFLGALLVSADSAHADVLYAGICPSAGICQNACANSKQLNCEMCISNTGYAPFGCMSRIDLIKADGSTALPLKTAPAERNTFGAWASAIVANVRATITAITSPGEPAMTALRTPYPGTPIEMPKLPAVPVGAPCTNNARCGKMGICVKTLPNASAYDEGKCTPMAVLQAQTPACSGPYGCETICEDAPEDEGDAPAEKLCAGTTEDGRLCIEMPQPEQEACNAGWLKRNPYKKC